MWPILHRHGRRLSASRVCIRCLLLLAHAYATPCTAKAAYALPRVHAGAKMTVAIVLHRADGAPVPTSFRRAPFGKDDPFARHREIAWDGPDSMIAGRTSFIGELAVASFPHIETIVVVEGELTLT